jgi:hypothetical protein
MDALCENVKVLMNGISEMETPTSLYFFFASFDRRLIQLG